ncbi:MAG: type IV pili methyl-accepting chemotaxis transducer N-terminal domain-containing protein, partial [Pseudomonadota bacterium]|nr:type IV pili methyl-accepting chemotaxis transducer N-terminal domain-containing protein [Pseudomonadota bacterium]
MSVIETIQKLFKPKPAAPQDSMDDVSLDMSVDPLATAALNSPGSMTVTTSMQDAGEGPESQNEEDRSEVAELLSLPVLGRRRMGAHQQILVVLLGFAVVVLASVTFVALTQADRVAQQVAATGQSLMQSQRLAKSVSQALVGSAQAFPDVRESSDVLAKTVRGLKSGDDSLRLAPVAAELQPDVNTVTPLMERAEKNASTVMAQQAILTQVGNALRTINRQSSDLLEIAETVSSLKLQQNAAPAEISAAGQLVMLTQRIGKSANEFLTMEGVSPEAVFLLGKDLNSFKEIAQGLQEGSPELRLVGSKDPQTRERLDALMALYEQTRVQAGAILGNLQGLVSAREAQASIISDSEPLRRGLEDIQGKLSSQTGLGVGALTTLAVAAAFALLCAAGLARLQVLDSRQRQGVAESQRLEAKGQEQDAKRVNDANQAAILRLMNELQTVAEGDLTQEATVTEDITGAIADSVNYTVEE